MPPPDEPTPGPFDGPLHSEGYEPALKVTVERLREKIKTLDPAKADELVRQIEEETKKKRSGAEILDTVFGIVGKAVGFVL